MEYHDVKRLALVLALQAEVEAMKAANFSTSKKSKPYKEEDFKNMVGKFNDLAYAHNEQL